MLHALSTDTDTPVAVKRGRPAKAKAAPVPPPPAEIPAHYALPSDVAYELTQLQNLRQLHIKRVALINLPIKALVRRMVGFSTFDEKPVRDAAMARYDAVCKVIDEDSGWDDLSPEDGRIAFMIKPSVDMSCDQIKAINVQRAETEKKMKVLAKTLPGADWVENGGTDTKGVGLLGLAVIVGEARADVERYVSPTALINRLGWGTTPDNLLANHACSKKRKAEVYSTVLEPMLKQQLTWWEKEGAKKTDVVKKPAYRYGIVCEHARARYDRLNENGAYAERALWELNAKTGATENQKAAWSKGMLTNDHLFKRAKREALCAFLTDLWMISRGLELRPIEKLLSPIPERIV